MHESDKPRTEKEVMYTAYFRSLQFGNDYVST